MTRKASVSRSCAEPSMTAGSSLSEKPARFSAILVLPTTVSIGRINLAPLNGLTCSTKSGPLTKDLRACFTASAMPGSSGIASLIVCAVQRQLSSLPLRISRFSSPSMVPSWPSSTTTVPVCVTTGLRVSSCMSEDRMTSIPGYCSASRMLLARPSSEATTSRSTFSTLRRMGMSSPSSGSPLENASPLVTVLPTAGSPRSVVSPRMPTFSSPNCLMR